MCDSFVCWPEARRGRFFSYLRMRHLPSRLPISVATDISADATRLISAELKRSPDVVVIDFAHAAVLMPKHVRVPSVLFTHNVEAEIFARHLAVAKNPLAKAIWQNQLLKMQRYEQTVLRSVNGVIAVSERDREQFRKRYGVESVAIPTGVDLESLPYRFDDSSTPPINDANIVFTAAMDSYANIDGIKWFMESVWPLIALQELRATMTIVGRNPDPSLVRAAKERGLPWIFTGTVEDVRPYVHKASIYVIPLRVGGGTRIKAFEAMALGPPVVSTSIGVEGLGLESGHHYLEADNAASFAKAVVQLIGDKALRRRLSIEARTFVERHFSQSNVARIFEAICEGVLQPAR